MTPLRTPQQWTTQMRHLVRTCLTYPYAFIHLWEGD
ncbi:hypothetical protein CD178_01295 [Komagataeibacter saccharivorans]|uniref:Uncharacterized protein n=1 Tax=Komagataeibacter saccharivorans TaxID=265959 RepID=A0A347WB35_9PROT|nr:hypothetical protein CD178_01295 [Komagataeibacter saccharivorans]QBL93991.1 hypothetical protein KSAC_17730 [Komagataeibacter saccharivorans]